LRVSSFWTIFCHLVMHQVGMMCLKFLIKNWDSKAYFVYHLEHWPDRHHFHNFQKSIL
jgi:hypothetical protein